MASAGDLKLTVIAHVMTDDEKNIVYQEWLDMRRDVSKLRSACTSLLILLFVQTLGIAISFCAVFKLLKGY